MLSLSTQVTKDVTQIANFQGRITGSICYFQCGSKFLMAKRTAYKASGANKWATPGGTREPGEAARETLDREIREELSVDLKGQDGVNELEHLFVRTEEGTDFDLYVFHMKVDGEFDVILDAEHSEYKWMTWNEIKQLTLMRRAVIEFIMEKVLSL